MEDRKELILTQKQRELKLESCAFSAYVIPVTFLSVLSCHFFLHLFFHFTFVTSIYSVQIQMPEQCRGAG